MAAENTHRDYGFDNIRAILIICVVFAHLLEIRTPFPFGSECYRVIYSFHMPVFLFVCGWFAKFDRNKIVLGLFLPYLMLQTAYIFFQRWLYGTEVLLQYTTPYWTLWFFLALCFYYLLIPLYAVHSPQKRWLGLAFALLLSLIAGYDRTVGYGMTLSRFFVFQPYFMLGFYARQRDYKTVSVTGKVLITAVLCAGVGIFLLLPVTNNMLYGSYPYVSLGYHPGVRLYLIGLALLWIIFFCGVVRPVLHRKIPLLTALGQHTLSVYLLHGFLVKYIGYRCPEILEKPWTFVSVTVGILLLTGNSAAHWLLRQIFPDFWIKRLRGIQNCGISCGNN